MNSRFTFGAAFGRRPIGIRNREPAENITLGPFHHRRLLVTLVVVADQMQEPMDGKVGDMMGERLVFAARLARDGLIGKHDVAEMFAAFAFGGE